MRSVRSSSNTSCARQEMHAQVLRRVEVLFADLLDSRGEEAVGEVGVCRGVGRYGHEQPPFAAAVTRLLGQLALRRGEHRPVGGFRHPGGRLVGGLSESVAVLVDEDEPSVARDGDDVDPVGIFENVIVGNAASVGQLEAFVADREPRFAREVFARQDFPLPVFQIFHDLACCLLAKIAKICYL